MQAEIIAIGDEITSGQLLDTNTQWLSQRFEELGIRVLYHTTVGDELEPMGEVFRQAIRRADVVVATGGLGPTADDLTREALAAATGKKLVADPDSLERIRRMYASRGRKMPKSNERQAMFPSGSRPIPNPNGTAPGVAMDVPREGRTPCQISLLPGVPAEMREMWFQTVADSLRRGGAGQRIIRHRNIKCFGAGESQVEEMLPDIIRRGRKPTVGINASKTVIILRITAEGATEEECFAAMEPTVATIRKCLGNLVFGEGDDQLQDAVARGLRQKNKTLATAEWGTEGLLANWLGSAREAQEYYLGGIVVPGRKVLCDALEVPAELLQQHSATSGEVAGEMAVRCRRRFRADYALSVGRFPLFDPAASQPKPVFFALATAEGVEVKSFPFAGHPALLKTFCAKRALNLVRLEMLGENHG